MKKFSFAATVNPEGLKSLGKGTRWENYLEHLPELESTCYLIWTLLDYSSRSSFSSLGKGVKRRVSQDVKSKRDFERLVDRTEVMSVLVGRRKLTLSHSKVELAHPRIGRGESPDGIPSRRAIPGPNYARIHFWIQEIVVLDRATGESWHDSALQYAQKCQENGYATEFYKTSAISLGCIVSLGRPFEYDQAIAEARSIAADCDGIDFRQSSLVREVPSPLSLDNEDRLCGFVAWDPDRGFVQVTADRTNAVLDRLIEHSTNDDPDADPESLQPGEVIESKFAGPLIDDKRARDFQTDFMVDSWFRELCVEKLGTRDPIVLKLLGHLLFTTWRSGQEAVIDTKLMQAIVGAKETHRAVIRPNLNKLNAVVPIEIKEHVPGVLATRYSSQSIPQEILEGAAHANHPLVNPVHLGSGGGLPGWTKKAERHLQERSTESRSGYPNPVAEMLINHLNNLPSNTFTLRTSGTIWTSMLNEAHGLEFDKRESALKTLRDIQLHPKPVYRRSKKTSRIYAMGGNFQYLQRSLRELAFKECWKFDLRHSQLSIAAMLFEAHELYPMLNDGTAWETLQGDTEIDKTELKKILYATLYMGNQELDPNCHPYVTDEDSTLPVEKRKTNLLRFFKIPQVEYLMEQRRLFIKRKLHAYTVDVFGNRFIEQKRKHKIPTLISSYEMLIFQKPLEYLFGLKEPKNRLILWLHDGFYYQGRQKDMEWVKKGIMRHFDTSLASLGIPGGLEVQPPD